MLDGCLFLCKFLDLEEWDFRTRNHGDMESCNAWMEELQGRQPDNTKGRRKEDS